MNSKDKRAGLLSPSLFINGAVLCCLMAVAFKPLAAAPAIDVPILRGPRDGAAVHHGVPGFYWRSVFTPNVRTMQGYSIQIARDDAFTEIVDEDQLPAVICWYVPDEPLSAGRYRWRLAAVDGNGRRGPWTRPRSFSVTTLPVTRVPAGSSFADIQRLLNAAAGETPSRVVFEPGEYRLDPGEAKCLIDLSNVHDLVIDGSGAAVVFTRAAAMINLTHCSRVLVRGFSFDYDPPVYTAGRIVSIDPAATTMDAEILPGHALPDAYPAYDRERKAMVVTEADDFAMKRGVKLIVPHAGFDRVAGRRYRFRFAHPRQIKQLSVGDIYVLDPRWYGAGGGTSVCVSGGEDVVLYDLTILGGANECLNSYYTDRLALLHINMERKPGRALSVNNGGNNHHNARRGPWIEGCLFENTGDDICHVNGLVMAAESQPAADRLSFNLHQPFDKFDSDTALDFRPGDRLMFYNRSEGKLVGERLVKAVAVDDGTVEVALDRGIKGVNTGRIRPAKGRDFNRVGNAEVTQVYNAGRSCNQFVFRNNVARRGRRVGVLAKGDGGWIEGNLFKDLGGGGVEFWNAPFEGPGAENYVVRDNRFENCCRIKRHDAPIWCSAFRPGGDRIHRNLLIEHNRIATQTLPAIDIGDADGVVLRHNKVDSAGAAPNHTKVQLRNTRNVLGGD